MNAPHTLPHFPTVGNDAQTYAETVLLLTQGNAWKHPMVLWPWCASLPPKVWNWLNERVLFLVNPCSWRVYWLDDCHGPQLAKITTRLLPQMPRDSKAEPMGAITTPPPVFGWCPLWSKDRLTLVQVFTNSEGLIMRVTINRRAHTSVIWGPTTEVFEHCENS